MLISLFGWLNRLSLKPHPKTYHVELYRLVTHYVSLGLTAAAEFESVTHRFASGSLNSTNLVISM